MSEQVRFLGLGCLSAVVAICLSSCGDSERALNRVEKDKRALEAENADLKVESGSLLNGLKAALPGDDTVWVVANPESSYDDAIIICSKMSYALPNEGQIENLKQRDPSSRIARFLDSLAQEATNGRLAPLHVLGKTVGAEKGFVICRKPDDAAEAG